MPQRAKLSRFLSRLLRHQPAAYGLTLDGDGFAPISAVWRVVQSRFPGLYTFDDLLSMQDGDTTGKKRFEIRDSPPRIRTMYGHSTGAPPIRYVRAAPPTTLYHGTTRQHLAQIMADGLQPRRRQYVHLTSSPAIARKVGSRHQGDAELVVLTIRAAEAERAGVAFYHPERDHYLAAAIPPQFIDFPPPLTSDDAPGATDWLRAAIRFLPERSVLVISPDLRFLIAEGSGLRSVGFQPQALVGRTIYEALSPDWIARVERTYQRTLAGESLVIEESIGRHVIQYRTYPLHDASGAIIAAVVLAQDVTEQRRIEQALRESQRFVERVTATMPDAVYVYDLEQRRSIYNNREIGHVLGYTPAELQGMGERLLPALMHPEDYPRQIAGLRRFDSAADGDVIESMYRFRHADGSWRWLYMRDTVFLRDEDGRARQILGVTQDITERIAAEEAALERERLRVALQKEQELGELKSGLMQRISHEFRTPLASIQMGTELLGLYLDKLTPEQRTNQVSKIKQEISRLTGMLDDIGLIVSGRIMDAPANQRPYDLGHDVRHLGQRMAIGAGSGHRFDIQIPPAPLIVHADQRMLQVLITNLLGNAIKFSPPGSTITLMLTATPDGVRLTVHDQGIGIPPTELERVHEPFVRGSNIGEIGGIGIGLTLARAVVDAHDGTLTITSRPAAGTTVQVELPILPE